MSISNSVSAAGSTSTPDLDQNPDPFIPSPDVFQKFELLGCYPFPISETEVEEREKGVKVVDPQMTLSICFLTCEEYGIAGVWNDTCVCGMGVPETESEGDDWPFLPAPVPAPTNRAQILLQEQTQEPEAGVCNLHCPGNPLQICGGGVEAVVQKREGGKEGGRWSIYRNLNLNLNLIVLNRGEDGNANAASNRYTNILAIKTETETETGNISTTSNATKTVFQSAATRRRGGWDLAYLSVVGVVASAVLMFFL
jgi:hypothetical protein